MSRDRPILRSALVLALTVLLLPAARLAAEEPADGDQQPARGYLGVALERLTPELQAHFGAPAGRGVLVASLSEESPAADAGVRVGDVITAIDGLPVGSPRELAREVRRRPGAAVEIELYRDGAARTLSATLGERRGYHASSAGRSPEEWAELGERMGRLGEELGKQFGERWGEHHAAEWQRLAEEMAARGEGWAEMGEEIGRSVERALSEIDWEAIGRAVEESLGSLEGIDWEEIGARVERQMAELERRLEERRQSGDRQDGGE